MDTSSLDANGSITVSCNNACGYVDAKLRLNSGSSGSCDTRTMKKLSDILRYNIFIESTHSSVFCSNGGWYWYLSGNTPWIFTATTYGRLFHSQINAPPGEYIDTITATLTYMSTTPSDKVFSNEEMEKPQAEMKFGQ